jgi:endonuclease/exonuclease/phosphatase family metal-dependent hydrolase
MAKAREERQFSVFNKILLWLNYISILALFISLCAKYISPELFWMIAFFGIAFPLLILLNILFFITIRDYVQISSSGEPSNSNIKVTSYNSMLFDLYNWSRNIETRRNILSSLEEINPDILCLQEFYNSDEENDFHNIDTIESRFSTKFHHVEYTSTHRNVDHWGIVTFSKYPIVNRGKIVFNTESNNICIFTDIIIRTDTVRIYNMHLQSISFSKSDYQFIDEIQNEKDARNELENSKSILRRLKRAFIKRAEQAEKVAASIQGCRYKIILCGDFNDTPASYAYHLLNKKLRDAFVEKGNGFGKTYAGKFPQFRIDYILHSPSIICKKFNRHDETFTDHYPITAYFELE